MCMFLHMLLCTLHTNCNFYLHAGLTRWHICCTKKNLCCISRERFFWTFAAACVVCCNFLIDFLQGEFLEDGMAWQRFLSKAAVSRSVNSEKHKLFWGLQFPLLKLWGCQPETGEKSSIVIVMICFKRYRILCIKNCCRRWMWMELSAMLPI